MKIEEHVFDDFAQKWSKNGILLGVASAARATELVNSGKYEIINRSAIDEVCF